jgi:CDP-diacylglycerol--glycerol-3-phosphate 3-phosphatidyltransferase
MMSQTVDGPSKLNAANLLSGLRLVMAPILLWLAWTHEPRWFLYALIVTLVSDIADGKVARRFNLTSEFGARLDSWGDFTTYMSLPLCTWWLRPEIVHEEAVFFWTVVAGYTLPVSIGFLKYGKLTSYHTRGAVIAAYALGASIVVIFAGGPTLPFRLATGVLVVAELEEIAITLVLPECVNNVKTLRVALELRRRLAADGVGTGAG